MAKPLKIAIVCDWLTNMGGAERVVLSMHKAFASAPIFTSVYEPEALPKFKSLDIRTTWLQKLPGFLRRRHQLFPVLRAYAFGKLDVSAYDVVISISGAEAKAVRVRPNAHHICYCLTPTRYYWSHYQDYKDKPGFGWLNPLVRFLIPPLVGWMRKLDLKSIDGVNEFVAISSIVSKRIKQFYNRDSEIIYPPVEMERFRGLDINKPRSGFIALGRQVPYKRTDLAVIACTELGLPLTVYGDGPEHRRLLDLAGPTITFKVDSSDEEVANALRLSQALIFPQEEDFGIVGIEAMAAGCPVIAYAKGGVLDTVNPAKTGLLFTDQTVESLKKTLSTFANQRFTPRVLQMHAEQFSEEKFIKQFQQHVNNYS